MAAPNTNDPAAQAATPQVAPARLRVRRLKIHRFMDVEPGTELEFHPGINVILGKNGSGKSTLLELLSAVVRGNYEAFRMRSFDVEYELSAGGLEVRGRVKNDPRVRASAQHSLTFRFDGQQFESDVSASDQLPEQPVRAARPGLDGALDFLMGHAFFRRYQDAHWEPHPSGSGKLFDTRKHQPALYASNALTGARDAFRLDEALDYFRFAIVGWDAPRVGLEFSRAVGSGEIGESTLAFAASFQAQITILNLAKQVGDSKALVLNPAFSYLGRLADFLGLKRIEFSIERQSLRREGDVETLSFEAPAFYFHTAGGDDVHHRDLSFGERRLLAIYHYLACNPDVAFIDELVNGLHHSWIANCLDEIGDRQAFLASQNPLLLDALAIPSAEDARTAFILCQREQPAGGKPVRRWGHMTEAQATHFYEAYEVGIQHVSEILRTEGLW